jgi:2,5-diketo-D-gluconate reductase B
MLKSEESLPGLGTWMNTIPEQCIGTVASALELGYRHVDTAQGYDNEEYVGEGIQRSSVERDDIFMSTKVKEYNLSYDDVWRTTERSLEKLGTDYIDLLYVHWPAIDYEHEATLTAFRELRDEGFINNIGVSNFTIELLDEARDVLSGDQLVVHQVEMHPYCQQAEMLEYTQKHDMYLVAYSPLARGQVFDIPQVVEIADKHGISPPQVSLAWLMSKDNVIPIPMADVKHHLAENLESRNIELDSEDIEMIESIEVEKKFVDPDFAPWN